MSIFCIGRNYVAHAHELGNEVPTSPVIFMKPSAALLAPGKNFTIPSFTNDLHYEGELVLRVIKQGKNLKGIDVLDYCDAITVGIDFTARDLQSKLKEKGLPWEKAKAFDDAAIIGNWVPLSASILTKPIHFSLHKNGSIVQDGDSSLMIFPLATILESITEYFTIYPGDLIYTGTPVGVGPTLKGDVFEGYLEANQVFSVKVNP
ncbi:MAG: fumarylacetoacetate hydrolase family protein [Chitinophagia bacterium]|jgi:2-keto-4-pentenoate hydratase/2-oxohepta-3-ene-1,7-dioic acid hydratase in catechol pathway